MTFSSPGKLNGMKCLYCSFPLVSSLVGTVHLCFCGPYKSVGEHLNGPLWRASLTVISVQYHEMTIQQTPLSIYSGALMCVPVYTYKCQGSVWVPGNKLSHRVGSKHLFLMSHLCGPAFVPVKRLEGPIMDMVFLVQSQAEPWASVGATCFATP